MIVILTIFSEIIFISIVILTVGMNRINQKYSYITHPDNLPLELNGSSKKRISSLNKQQFRQSRCDINQESRSILLNKLSQGQHDCQLVKSVLPGNERRKEPRRSSVRTYNDNKQNIKSSGIEYLMQKTQHAKPTVHKERAHVYSQSIDIKKMQQKKHFVAQNTKTYVDQVKRPVHSKQAEKTKLTRDIYSNMFRLEKQSIGNKKQQPRNLFKKGEDLGLEAKRQKKFSDLKMIEMVGSQHVKQTPKGLREKRQDWRISNINFY